MLAKYALLAPANATFACACPRRLRCDAEIQHPACEVCDDCRSGVPATCVSDQDYDYRPNDDDILPPWMLARMGY